jgi:hypothetical protein
MQLGIKDELEKLVREGTENPTQQIPGLVFQCVNRDGVRVLMEKTKNNRITLRMLATHTGTNSLIRYHALPPIVDH